MIITKVRIQEDHPTTVLSGEDRIYSLPVIDFNLNSIAGENGYLTKSIVGLGPTKQNAVIEGFDLTGIPILGNQAEKRQIGFRVGFHPIIGKSISDLRDDMYKYMSRSILVSLMYGSMIVAQTRGYITAMDPVHFSAQPEIQFYVNCDDGELSAPKAVNIPLIDLSVLHPIVSYDDGTSPAGLELNLTITTNHSSFGIIDHGRQWYSQSDTVHNAFVVTYPFLVGDILTISTHPTDRKIELNRSSVIYDLAGYLNSGAIWPKLYFGVNTFSWNSTPSWFTMNSATYTPRFWGV